MRKILFKILSISALIIFSTLISYSQTDIKSLKWNPTMGPFGCDATSFYIDGNGNYWLGTGSSGGVYFSKNKGKSWEERNNGIGPVHIGYINKMNDSVFIQVSEYTFGKSGSPSAWLWNEKSKTWSEIKDENKAHDIMKRLEENATKNATILEKEYPFMNFSPVNTRYSHTDYLAMNWGVYPYTIAWGANMGVYEGYVFSHISGFYESSAHWAQINRTFPRDMFKLPAGNVFPDNKKAILLAKSGVYNFDGNIIKPLPIKNIVATDVRQIVCTKDQILYALVGESDIWQYKNNKWTCVFNAYSQHIKRESGSSPAGYDTKLLNLLNDGTILFCFCGDVWQIDLNGQVKSVIQSAIVPDSVDNNLKQKLFYTSMARDKGGNYFGVASFIHNYLSTGSKSSENVLVKLATLNSTPEIVSTINTTNNWYGYLAFAFNDKAGNTWLKGDEKIYQIGNGSDTSIYYTTTANRWINGFAFAANGDFYYLNGENGIAKWVEADKKWVEITTPELEGIQCIGIDLNNDIYAGTGYTYNVSCGNFKSGKADGVYKLMGEKWVKIEGEPNKWILSLGSSYNKGVPIGTSGSGLWFINSSKE
ncbi:MAG: hypothetical protein WCP69_13855 [Bacteroidota bacterium]